MGLAGPRIEVEQWAVRLGRATGNARTSFAERAGLFVRIVDGGGRVGQGEAAPLPGYSPDTLEECLSALDRAEPERLVHVQQASDVLGALAPYELPAAARFALETAALDLLAQRRGVPLHGVLREVVEARAASCSSRTTLPPVGPRPVSGLVDATDADEAVEEARAAVRRGLGTVKLKLGRTGFAADSARVARVREAIGPSVALRLDANGSLPLDEAPSLLAALAEHGPELLEEPCAGMPLALWRDVPDEPWPPLALDESLQQPGTMERLAPVLATGRVAAVVLKPTALGGLGACIDLAVRARALGAEVIVTHCFEGPVAYAACGALALALGVSTYAVGLDAHATLAGFPSVRVPSNQAAWVVPLATPGLGIGRVERP